MLVRCVSNPKTVMEISQGLNICYINSIHVGKEYTLHTVTSIQIAVSTIKGTVGKGQVSVPVSVFGGK